MRFAKILRFGRTRADIGVDLNNLLNTNYATGFNDDVYLQHRQHAAPERLGHADQHLQPAVRASELHGELLIPTGGLASPGPPHAVTCGDPNCSAPFRRGAPVARPFRAVPRGRSRGHSTLPARSAASAGSSTGVTSRRPNAPVERLGAASVPLAALLHRE